MTMKEFRTRPIAVYGRMANRPLPEIQDKCSAAGRVLVTRANLPVFSNPPARRYAQNSANHACGYIEAERAVWLAALTAQTCAEIRFAWFSEMRVARAGRDVERAVADALRTPSGAAPEMKE